MTILDVDKLDEIIVDAIDVSINEVECQTLRWVLDKISELSPVMPEAEPCEDAISRQEAIKEFQIYREYSSNRSNSDWVDRIEAVLKDLPSVTPWSDWIPVSEKLPEPLTAVLLTVRYKSTGQWIYQIGYWEDALEKWEKWLEIGTLDDEFEILAWMELPEGYEEDRHA